ncbi:3043_t:CDS:2, partial [Racocetra persica]
LMDDLTQQMQQMATNCEQLTTTLAARIKSHPVWPQNNQNRPCQSQQTNNSNMAHLNVNLCDIFTQEPEKEEERLRKSVASEQNQELAPTQPIPMDEII